MSLTREELLKLPDEQTASLMRSLRDNEAWQLVKIRCEEESRQMLAAVKGQFDANFTQRGVGIIMAYDSVADFPEAFIKHFEEEKAKAEMQAKTEAEVNASKQAAKQLKLALINGGKTLEGKK